MEVYRTVRRRQLKIPTRLPVLTVAEGLRRVQMFHAHQEMQRQTISDDLSMDVDGPILPGCDVEYIKIQISHRIDVGHFWAQNYDDQTTSNLCYIQKELNKNTLNFVQGRIELGGIYAAPFQDDNLYYRCRVIEINHITRDRIMAQVHLVHCYI